MGNLAQTFTVPVTVVSSIPGVPIPPSLSFTGIDLLNEVGRATTRPDVIDDPDRLFALFRYGTKVSAHKPNLRLSHQRLLRDIHRSSVLSDELGAGFALLFGSQVLGASLFLDLPDAVRRRRIMPPAPKTTVPDYIGLYGPSHSVLVLEAKGSQTRNRCSSTQIPKGCTQVASVSLPAGRSALRVVVGTELHKDNQHQDTTVFIGDPPEERRSYPYFEDETPEDVTVREHYRRVAALVGDVRLFRRAERGEAPDEELGAPLVKRIVEDRAALGSTFTIRSRNGAAGFFVGIDVETRDSLLQGLSETATPVIPSLRPSHGRRHAQRELSAYSMSPDGTVLEFWFEGAAVDQVPAE